MCTAVYYLNTHHGDNKFMLLVKLRNIDQTLASMLQPPPPQEFICALSGRIMTDPVIATLRDNTELVVEQCVWNEALKRRVFKSNVLHTEINTVGSTQWRHGILKQQLASSTLKSDWDRPSVRLKVYGELAQTFDPDTPYNNLTHLDNALKPGITTMIMPIFEDNDVFKERCQQIEDGLKLYGFSNHQISKHHDERKARWPDVFAPIRTAPEQRYHDFSQPQIRLYDPSDWR